jgi:hypothetical protein
VDPVAGLFQNFNIPGWRSPYPGNGWYRDLATPGFESAFLGLTEMPTALQWLGQVIATDPRFEMSTVRLAYQVVVGGRGLDQPTDVDDPAFVEDLAAFRAQRERFQEYAQVLVESDFNFKALIEAIVFSPYFTTQSRREGVPEERYASFYTRRLMTPEEMSRKIGSLFGAVWDKDGQDLLRDKDDYLFLYGGIDSTAVVERTTSPTSTIAAVAATFAHDLACRHVAADFTLPASERRLFPFAIGGSEEAVRANLVYLHRFLLGELVDDESAEIDIALRLYNDVLSEGQKGLAEGRYTLDLDADCQAGPLRSDPTYEARAWSAVLTYLLQTQEFLYH